MHFCGKWALTLLQWDGKDFKDMHQKKRTNLSQPLVLSFYFDSANFTRSLSFEPRALNPDFASSLRAHSHQFSAHARKVCI